MKAALVKRWSGQGRLVLIILTASLILNLALAWLSMRQGSTVHAATPAAGTPLSWRSLLPRKTDPDAELKALKAQWTKARIARTAGTPARDPRLTDPDYVLERLRSEGMPPHLIQVLVRNALQESKEWVRLDAIKAARGREATEAWIRQMEMLTDYQRQTFTPRQKRTEEQRDRLTYGTLPAAKVVAIKDLLGTRKFRYAPHTLVAEAEPAIRALLTPEEADDYLRYNSQRARDVQDRLRFVTVTEEEYLHLLDTPLGERRGWEAGSSSNFKLTDFAVVQQVLGDERYLRVMREVFDREIEADPIFQAAGATFERRLELLEIAHDHIETIGFMTSQRPPARPLAYKSKAQATYRAMTAGLDPTIIQAFNQTGFGKDLRREMEAKD